MNQENIRIILKLTFFFGLIISFVLVIEYLRGITLDSRFISTLIFVLLIIPIIISISIYTVRFSLLYPINNQINIQSKTIKQLNIGESVSNNRVVDSPDNKVINTTTSLLSIAHSVLPYNVYGIKINNQDGYLASIQKEIKKVEKLDLTIDQVLQKLVENGCELNNGYLIVRKP